MADLPKPTATRVVLLLGCTALPILLTHVMFVVLYSADAPPSFLLHLPSPVLAQGLYACALVPVLVAVLLIERRRLRDFGLRIHFTRTRALAALVGFLVGVLVFVGVDLALRAFGIPPVAGMDIGRPTVAATMVLLAGPVLIAPFAEEVFFRVLWIGMLGRRIPPLLAAAASIAAFSAYHYPNFGAGGSIFIAVWSVVPVGLFLWTGDITASLMMHVLNNAFAYVLVPVTGVS